MAAHRESLLAIEQLLDGKTTLKTQRVTHENILCVGTEVLENIRQLMLEDSNKAIADAVFETERKAAQKLNSEMKLLEDILLAEKENEISELQKKFTTTTADLQRQWEVAERKRSRDLRQLCQQDKDDAVAKALEQAKQETERIVAQTVHELTEKLRFEGRAETERILREELAIAQEKAQTDKMAAVEDAKQKCTENFEKSLNIVKEKHQQVVEGLETRIADLESRLDKETLSREKVEDTLTELTADYKRFQDYTTPFHSDYLLP